MKVRELAEKLGAKVLSGEENLETEISCGYSCDLLSWVLLTESREWAGARYSLM